MKPILSQSIDGFVSEPDLEIGEGAMLANLKLIEGVAESYPDDEDLQLMAAMARANYAFAFVQDELEAVRLAYPGDASRAEPLIARATASMKIGQRYAERVLRMNDDFQEQIGDRALDEVSDETFAAAVATLDEDEVGALFWLIFNWGGRIQVQMDIEEATQLPKLEIALAKVLEVDEGYFYGIGPHLMAGLLHGFRAPAIGGNPKKAEQHFETAKELGEGGLLSDVLLAQFVHAQTEQQDAFETTLMNVITASVSEDRALLDALAKRKACRLYANLDQFFLADAKAPPVGCRRIPHKHPLRAPE
jgi:hypothetical protein